MLANDGNITVILSPCFVETAFLLPIFHLLAASFFTFYFLSNNTPSSCQTKRYRRNPDNYAFSTTFLSEQCSNSTIDRRCIINLYMHECSHVHVGTRMHGLFGLLNQIIIIIYLLPIYITIRTYIILYLWDGYRQLFPTLIPAVSPVSWSANASPFLTRMRRNRYYALEQITSFSPLTPHIYKDERRQTKFAVTLRSLVTNLIFMSTDIFNAEMWQSIKKKRIFIRKYVYEL